MAVKGSQLVNITITHLNFFSKHISLRAELNPKPRESRFWDEIGYCYPVGEGHVVQVPPDQSLASGSVVKSEGKPGNGSPKPDGSRMQALY